MAKTVNEAFKLFLANTVEIDPEINNSAKASRNWLMENIEGFDSTEGFFKLYPEVDMHFGSFARKTKIQPLDDIDLMIGMSALGSTYDDSAPANDINIDVHSMAKNLLAFCNDGTSLLNSRKVINAFIAKLEEIPQYQKADIKRNQAACTLKLKSYTWNFDIVPCFFTSPDNWGRTYYLIPNGNGKWQKTDPRIDQINVSELNQRHNGNLLRLIRLAKYWQKRPTMPTMSSYLLEVMVLNYFRGKLTSIGIWPDIELGGLFNYIALNVMGRVADPQNLKWDINELPLDARTKISERATADAIKAAEARAFESAGETEKSINKWIEIFGDQFPSYTK